MSPGGCGRPPSAVWTSHAVEDAPRRVWTPRCGCGRTSAGVEAPSSGEDAPAISSAFPGGSALVLSSSFHRGLFAPACRVSWPGRWGEPRVCRPSAAGWWEGPCGRRWVSGRGGRVAPADCAVSHHSADREVSDHLFFPHLIAAKSDLAAVLNEGCVFPTRFINPPSMVGFADFALSWDRRLKMTAENIPEEELSCDMEMEGFTREGPHFSILGNSWDCENQEGHLRQSALTQEEPGAQEAIREYPGFGEHLSVSPDLPRRQRVSTRNGFHVRGSGVKSLDCDPALHNCQKSYVAKRTEGALPSSDTKDHTLENNPWIFNERGPHSSSDWLSKIYKWLSQGRRAVVSMDGGISAETSLNQHPTAQGLRITSFFGTRIMRGCYCEEEAST
eukprot:bmy_13343T0